MISKAEKKAVHELTDTFAMIMDVFGMPLSDKELRLLKQNEVKRYAELKKESKNVTPESSCVSFSIHSAKG